MDCRITSLYICVDDMKRAIKFYEEFFDIDLLEPFEEGLAIKDTVWKKLYTKGMDKARNYFKEHQNELLDQLNQALFNEISFQKILVV